MKTLDTKIVRIFKDADDDIIVHTDLSIFEFNHISKTGEWRIDLWINKEQVACTKSRLKSLRKISDNEELNKIIDKIL